MNNNPKIRTRSVPHYEGNFQVNRVLLTVRTKFEALHHWPTAPEGVESYLRSPHRHLFYVTLNLEVDPYADRQIEFVGLKRKLEEYLRIHISKPCFNNDNPEISIVWKDSCESFAFNIGSWAFSNYRQIKNLTVEVSEDGENGAYVNMSRKQGPEFQEAKGLTVPEKHNADPEKLNLNAEVRFPFFGVEAEGPYEGIPTLFVPFESSLEDVDEACTVFKNLLIQANGKNLHIETWRGRFQIYLGAGNLPLQWNDSDTEDNVKSSLYYDLIRNHFFNKNPNFCKVGFADLNPIVMVEIGAPYGLLTTCTGPGNKELKNTGHVAKAFKKFKSGIEGNVYTVSANPYHNFYTFEDDVFFPNFVKMIREDDKSITWRNLRSNYTWTTSMTSRLFDHDIGFNKLEECPDAMKDLMVLYKNWLHYTK